jgi:hypothetical protein
VRIALDEAEHGYSVLSPECAGKWDAPSLRAIDKKNRFNSHTFPFESGK